MDTGADLNGSASTTRFYAPFFFYTGGGEGKKGANEPNYTHLHFILYRCAAERWTLPRATPIITLNTVGPPPASQSIPDP